MFPRLLMVLITLLMTPDTTPFIVFHAPRQSPVIICMIVFMIPKTAFIAPSIITLIVFQTPDVTIDIAFQAPITSGLIMLIAVVITAFIAFQTVVAVLLINSLLFTQKLVSFPQTDLTTPETALLTVIITLLTFAQAAFTNTLTVSFVLKKYSNIAIRAPIAAITKVTRLVSAPSIVANILALPAVPTKNVPSAETPKPICPTNINSGPMAATIAPITMVVT